MPLLGETANVGRMPKKDDSHWPVPKKGTPAAPTESPATENGGTKSPRVTPSGGWIDKNLTD